MSVDYEKKLCIFVNFQHEIGKGVESLCSFLELPFQSVHYSYENLLSGQEEMRMKQM